LICGTKEDVSRAHLVVGVVSEDYDYHEFNPPKYKTTLDPKSASNFIPLCGNKGKNGTCHDAFDKFRLTIVHNILLDTYTCICFDGNTTFNGKLLTVHKKHKPYKRLLAWHARYCLGQNPVYVMNNGGIKSVENLLNIIDASEDMESMGGDIPSSSSSTTV